DARPGGVAFLPAGGQGPFVTTVAQARAAGRAARKNVPRRAHAAYGPASGREDPVAVLERQARDRVPNLVPIRYGRMLTSPFAFFRGGAEVMAGQPGPPPRNGL